MTPPELPIADLHLPPAISFWPLAPGWWLLAGLIILFFSLLLWAIWRFKLRRVQRNLALNTLDAIDLQSYTAAEQINQVLKRAALAYLPREVIAPLNGQMWKRFLLMTLDKQEVEFEDQWLQFAYSAKVDQQSIYRYYSFARLWLSTALPLNKKLVKLLLSAAAKDKAHAQRSAVQ